MGILRGEQTASATVFVDEYVNAGLPRVCALSGEPSTMQLRSEKTIDSPSAGWLFLILFGPVGWVIVALVFLTGRRGKLTGSLPMDEVHYLAAKARRHRSYLVLLFGLAILVCGLLADPVVPLAFSGVLAAVTLFAGWVLHVIESMRRPAIDLDASGRWVMIYNVHPEFARACREMAPRRARATSRG
ncbi:MAG: hypothetical protein IH940_05590 [Acidobacteria bacterium]|nr:hypothetical protein [Acidobacteriota bacterium]